MIKAVFLVLAIGIVVAAIVVLANYKNGLDGSKPPKKKGKKK